jgi:hypothetical protein
VAEKKVCVRVRLREKGVGEGSFIPELPCSREKVEMRERKQRNVKERKKGRERERERERESDWLGVRRWDKNIQLQHGQGKIDI